MATSTIPGIKISYERMISLNPSWTCTKDGFLIVRAKVTTSGAHYLYIKDSTLQAMVAQHYAPTSGNGTYFTCFFPVLKGHIYEVDGQTGASIDGVYQYILM